MSDIHDPKAGVILAHEKLQMPRLNAAALPERFHYLFDNMEAEMVPLLAEDRVMVEQREKKARYQKSVEGSEQREAEARAEREAAEAKVLEIKTALHLAERDLRIAQGKVSAEKYSQQNLGRYIKSCEIRMAQREKNILIYEARKRLNAMGRTLKANRGARIRKSGTSGGFDIVKIDGQAV